MDEADSLLWEHSLAGGDLNSLWSLWNHAAEQYLGAQGKRGQLRMCVRTLETPEGNPKASNLAEREECIMQLHHALDEGPVNALRWPQWLGIAPPTVDAQRAALLAWTKDQRDAQRKAGLTAWKKHVQEACTAKPRVIYKWLK
eukprot:262029-Amphidinium_carterae.1